MHLVDKGAGLVKPSFFFPLAHNVFQNKSIPSNVTVSLQLFQADVYVYTFFVLYSLH
jgi:hypothetical protein